MSTFRLDQRLPGPPTQGYTGPSRSARVPPPVTRMTDSGPAPSRRFAATAEAATSAATARVSGVQCSNAATPAVAGFNRVAVTIG